MTDFLFGTQGASREGNVSAGSWMMRKSLQTNKKGKKDIPDKKRACVKAWGNTHTHIHMTVVCLEEISSR
jgi:hypothetical protein